MTGERQREKQEKTIMKRIYEGKREAEVQPVKIDEEFEQLDAVRSWMTGEQNRNVCKLV